MTRFIIKNVFQTSDKKERMKKVNSMIVEQINRKERI